MTPETMTRWSTSERRRCRRLIARRDFVSHLLAYVLVNTFLIGVWVLGGAGYFWPAWVIGVWGGIGPPCQGRIRASSSDRGRHRR